MTRNYYRVCFIYFTEIQRLAYADRAIHLGDPDFYPSPVPMLISKDYAKKRLKLVSMYKATPSTDIAAGSTIPESMETTHYSAMDKLGNTVGITTTINLSYGNKKIVDGAGFLLNNEMDDFASSPGSQNAFGLIGYEANSIKPAKRTSKLNVSNDRFDPRRRAINDNRSSRRFENNYNGFTDYN